MADEVQTRLQALEEGQEWLTGKIHKTDDRVDRLFEQARVFCINSRKLEELWQTHGNAITMVLQGEAGSKWVEEMALALDFEYPLKDDHPPRDEQKCGRRARDLLDSLRALHEEVRTSGFLRVEAEYGGEDRNTRKAKAFTLVWRLGAAADRVERHISTYLDAALA